MEVCSTNGKDSLTTTFRSEENCDEEGFRAALNGPNQVGAGETLSGVTAPTFSAFLQRGPVLELADRRDLHSRDLGRPGPIPGWATILLATTGNLVDNNTAK
jgi:hypothetical protein